MAQGHNQRLDHEAESAAALLRGHQPGQAESVQGRGQYVVAKTEEFRCSEQKRGERLNQHCAAFRPLLMQFIAI